MATSLGISARLSRSMKKQELPYAFNSTSTALVSKLRQDGQLSIVENVMQAVEQVSALLTSGYDGQIKDNILNMCQHLKVYGACLEVLNKEQLDRAFVVFRNSSQDEDKLDYHSRLHLLELIELRANHWKGTDVMSQYYKKKGHTHGIDNEITNAGGLLSESASSASIDSRAFMSPLTAAAPLLGPGDIMKSSGKFAKPTRIPGKNYCKDEVVIRNADSGKVNPGAKERLVQITGANEGSINHAKQLIEDTIRRNASPIRDPNSAVGALAGSSSSIASTGSDDSAPRGSSGGGVGSGSGTGGITTGVRPATLLHSLSTGDANIGEYKYTVTVRGHSIKITGNNHELVRMSKLVLDEFFSGEPINGVGEFFNFETLPRSPLSPHDSIESDTNEVFTTNTNGQTDETASTNNATTDSNNEYQPLRRPKLTIDVLSNNNNTVLSTVAAHETKEIGGDNNGDNSNNGNRYVYDNSNNGNRYVYSMDFLARMSYSPLCVPPPADWSRISCEHPTITRKVVDIFDADQYLSNLATQHHVLCTSASDESILSGSSV